MNVKELILYLKQLPEETEIIIVKSQDDHASWVSLDEYHCMHSNDSGVLRIADI